MIGTVEEAKLWWCPLARVAAPQDSQWGHTSGNRWWDDTSAHCIGNRCAAWRWAVKDPATYDKPVGYCGAFGRPEAE